ncbi:hypothetical protein BGZ92_007893 [Podila epicladia]|nr:hypothetical protein BGZ92_007893 [Podila epicladia]
MTPEELAALFKRRGDFDDTRKNLLSDFQSSTVGQQFTHQLSDILQSCIDEDPSLLQRERSEFHQLMVDRITKSTEYKKVQQFVDSLLQPAQYMSKIESTLMTIVKEQAPVVEKEVNQDKDRETSSSSSSTAKRNSLHSLDSTKKGKGEKLEKSASKTLDKRARGPEPLPAKTVPLSPSLPSEVSTKKDMDADINEDDKENVIVQNGSSDTIDSRDSPRPKSLSSQSPSLRKKGSRSLGSMHITPKKRNRRQSADSNSSLSSPPSSSEPDSDIDDPMAEGGRAKKVIKKANKDTDPTGKADHGTFGNNSLDSVNTLSDPGVDSSMDIDPVTSVKPEPIEGKDVEMTTEQESQEMKVEIKDNGHLEPPTTDSITTSKANSPDTTVKKERPSETSGDRPSAIDASQSSPSTAGAPTVKDSQKPITPSSYRKETESDRPRSSSGSSLHRPAPPLKRTHTPQPLPPRPNIVPLPPKPTSKPSSNLSRRTSHSRNTSAATTSATVGNSSTHSGSPKSPSSGTNTSSATAGSSSSPSLPSLSSAGSLGTTSRHHSFSGRGGDSLHSGHSHQVHPLPPPPHHLQHPLPPTPRPGLTTSRSTPHSLNTKTGQVHSHGKPNISTSPSFHSPPAASSSTTPTTPRSANITSPDSTKSPQDLQKNLKDSKDSNDSKDSKDSKDKFKETEVAKETSSASSPPKTESSQLRSPGSNSSNDSISSTGSLSTTGSTSGAAELSSSQITTETASQPPVKTSEDVTNPKEQAKETEPIAASPPPSANGLKESGSDNLPSSPGSMSTSSPQPTALASVCQEAASSDHKSGRPRLSSPGSSDSHVPQLGVPRSSSLSSVPKSGHSGSASSPPAHLLPSKSHTLSSSSTSTSSSPSASGGSHKLKPIGRTPIPLPHKPIPLPPKPTLGGSTSTGSPPTSSSFHSKHRRK